MRTPSDLPPRQRRSRGLSDRGRIALIVVAVLLVVLLLTPYVPPLVLWLPNLLMGR